MLLAMMPPLLAMPLMHVYWSSLPRRRVRALACFVGAYGSVWLAAGLSRFVCGLLLYFDLSKAVLFRFFGGYASLAFCFGALHFGGGAGLGGLSDFSLQFTLLQGWVFLSEFFHFLQ